MKTGFANPSILCSHHLGVKGAGEAQGHARILEANLSFPSTASRGSIGLFGDSHSASWVELNHLGFFFCVVISVTQNLIQSHKSMLNPCH